MAADVEAVLRMLYPYALESEVFCGASFRIGCYPVYSGSFKIVDDSEEVFPADLRIFSTFENYSLIVSNSSEVRVPYWLAF